MIFILWIVPKNVRWPLLTWGVVAILVMWHRCREQTIFPLPIVWIWLAYQFQRRCLKNVNAGECANINSLGDPAAKPDDQYQRNVCLEAPRIPSQTPFSAQARYSKDLNKCFLSRQWWNPQIPNAFQTRLSKQLAEQWILDQAKRFAVRLSAEIWIPR